VIPDWGEGGTLGETSLRQLVKFKFRDKIFKDRGWYVQFNLKCFSNYI